MRKMLVLVIVSLLAAFATATCAIGDGIWECDVTADPLISCDPLKTGPTQTFKSVKGYAPDIVQACVSVTELFALNHPGYTHIICHTDTCVRVGTEPPPPLKKPQGLDGGAEPPIVCDGGEMDAEAPTVCQPNSSTASPFCSSSTACACLACAQIKCCPGLDVCLKDSSGACVGRYNCLIENVPLDQCAADDVPSSAFLGCLALECNGKCPTEVTP